MLNIKVLKSNKREKETVSENYFQALQRFMERHPDVSFDNRELAKQKIFLLVKCLSIPRKQAFPCDAEAAQNIFYVYSATTDLLAELTPIEFMNMFPIEKTYDGKRFEMKDYFSTIEKMKKYPPDKPIGEERIMYFLWDYWNRDINNFEVNKMCAMSNLRKCMGEKGLMEEFCENNGIPTYTSYDDLGIMVENGIGKVIKVSKPKKRIPKSLRVVK